MKFVVIISNDPHGLNHNNSSYYFVQALLANNSAATVVVFFYQAAVLLGTSSLAPDSGSVSANSAGIAWCDLAQQFQSRIQLLMCGTVAAQFNLQEDKIFPEFSLGSITGLYATLEEPAELVPKKVIVFN